MFDPRIPLIQNRPNMVHQFFVPKMLDKICFFYLNKVNLKVFRKRLRKNTHSTVEIILAGLTIKVLLKKLKFTFVERIIYQKFNLFLDIRFEFQKNLRHFQKTVIELKF